MKITQKDSAILEWNNTEQAEELYFHCCTSKKNLKSLGETRGSNNNMRKLQFWTISDVSDNTND